MPKTRKPLWERNLDVVEVMEDLVNWNYSEGEDFMEFLHEYGLPEDKAEDLFNKLTEAIQIIKKAEEEPHRAERILEQIKKEFKEREEAERRKREEQK